MSNSDKKIGVVVALIIVVHITIFILSLTQHAFSFLVALTNLLVGVSILAYWIQKQIRITKHIIDSREIIFLSMEVVASSFALSSFLLADYGNWLPFINYFFLGTHLLIFIGFLVFMLTFKMKRLF